MITLKPKREHDIELWAKQRNVSPEEMADIALAYALRHAPKNIDEFDEDGIPYASEEEMAELKEMFDETEDLGQGSNISLESLKKDLNL